MDLACNLVRILDCDFIVSRAFSGFKFRQDHCRIADFVSNLGGSADLYTPIPTPPPPPPLLVISFLRYAGTICDVSEEGLMWNTLLNTNHKTYRQVEVDRMLLLTCCAGSYI